MDLGRTNTDNKLRMFNKYPLILLPTIGRISHDRRSQRVTDQHSL